MNPQNCLEVKWLFFPEKSNGLSGLCPILRSWGRVPFGAMTHRTFEFCEIAFLCFFLASASGKYWFPFFAPTFVQLHIQYSKQHKKSHCRLKVAKPLQNNRKIHPFLRSPAFFNVRTVGAYSTSITSWNSWKDNMAPTRKPFQKDTHPTDPNPISEVPCLYLIWCPQPL